MISDPPDFPPGVERVDPKVVPFTGNKGNGRAHAGRPFYFIDDQAAVAHVDWLIKGVLPTRGIAVLGGATSTGKTYLALDIALAVMLGTDFNGHIVKHPGAVMWLAAEGQSQLQPRWQAIYRAKAAPFFEQMNFGLDQKLPLIWVPDVPKLNDQAGLNANIATMQAVLSALKVLDVPLRLLVIDTFTAATVFQDANSAAETAKAMDAVKRIEAEAGCMVLLLDHYGKDAERGLRGSSVKMDAVDTLLHIVGERAQVDGLELELAKMRGGEAGERMTFSLKKVTLGVDEDGEDITQRVVAWGGAIGQRAAAGVKVPPKLSMLLRAMNDLEPDDRTQPLSRPNIRVRGVEEERLRQEYYKRYTAQQEPGTDRNGKYVAFKRALEAGIEKRLLDKDEHEGRSLVWIVKHVETTTEKQ